MDTISSVWNYSWPFLVTISVIVFVHELGHYLIARLNGVRVEVFSLGFGPEITGFRDSHGTRWKLSLLPLGGYVKFFGDANAASGAKDPETLATLGAEDRRVSFHHKKVHQRAAVVIGGPLGNFVFAAIVFAILFAVVGERYSSPTISNVVEGSAAESVGMLPGDRVVQVDGRQIEKFEDILSIVQWNTGEPLKVEVDRGGQRIAFSVVPKEEIVKDPVTGDQKVRRIGIGAEPGYREVGTGYAIWAGVRETYRVAANSLQALGQMITGQRSTDELGGPIKIGYLAGKIAKERSFIELVLLVATLSVSLGLINLFPVPMLDGGHLIFYLWEAIVGRPLKPRIQEYSLRFGFVLVIALMVWVTSKDIIWQVRSGSGPDAKKTELVPAEPTPQK